MTFGKKIGCRTPHPDHFLVIKMNFTQYIRVYKILYVRAIKRMSLTVSFVVLYFFACRRKFQFLLGRFLYPVRYQFICDITLRILYAHKILSHQSYHY